jgi:murein DD-endopeptidase MepM/ murein hydrolase activator NlpD
MEQQKKKLIHKLRYKYRLILINDETFEEKFSFKLTPMNVFVGFSSSLVSLTILIILLIFFTPLKEYVPGYTDTKTKRNIQQLLFKADSLEESLKAKETYYKNLLNIMNGGNGLSDSISTIKKTSSKNNKPITGEKELAFRSEFEKSTEQVKNQDKIKQNSIADYRNLFLMTPTKGLISKPFNPGDDHFAIDIASIPDAPVKAVQEGTVIFADWTPDAGKTIAIQHTNNLISIYKHNSALLKKVGMFVGTGEVVAIVGNSGELSTGPHLHLELWENGKALNPEDLLTF